MAKYNIKSEEEEQLELIEKQIKLGNEILNERLIKCMKETVNNMLNDQIIPNDAIVERDLKKVISGGFLYLPYNHELYAKAIKQQDKRRKMIKEKVDDIIVALELGGTKADLERMLAEI